jgi:hypothetical protein
MAHSFLGCSPAWCRASFHTQENAPSFKFPHDRGRDPDGSKVDLYRNQKPIMALPAIYFLDGKGTVVDLLQGEVTSDQIAGVLQTR